MRRARLVCAEMRRVVISLFALGLGIGGGLGLIGLLMWSVGPGNAGATHDSSGNVHACVSQYTGNVRIVPPGQPPNCSASEMLVELGGPDPIVSMNFEVRTSNIEVLAGTTDQDVIVVACETGETAISGGGRISSLPLIVDSIDFDKGGGPIGSPPTGWWSGLSWENPTSSWIVETWVLCAS